MANGWNSTDLVTEEKALCTFTNLRRKRWLFRGHSKCQKGLEPKIDREPRDRLSRADKLALERRSIDLFRSTARFFASSEEKKALTDDITALMVLQHYGVPTRLLDWSSSPWVAAYFATRTDDACDGEIWAFDEPLYEVEGKKQWEPWDKIWPWWTAFELEDPTHWFVCTFYEQRFPRLEVQQGAFTMTPQFGVDHATAIAQLFVSHPDRYHRYTIAAELKRSLRQVLREQHDIWRGSLFPDSAGAADTVRKEIPRMDD